MDVSNLPVLVAVRQAENKLLQLHNNQNKTVVVVARGETTAKTNASVTLKPA